MEHPETHDAVHSLGREILCRVGGPRCHEAMQCLRPDVSVATQHLPILVPGHQCNLFDGQADLEQTAGAFVAEVVEVEVLDVSIGTGSAERRADRFGIVGEDLTLRPSEILGLRHDEGPGIKSGGGEERDPLVVAGLVARVLAVSDQEHPAVDVEVAPVGAADLVQPHRGSDGELHDARHGHRQTRILVKAAEEAAEFSRRRASVALDTLADETKPL